MKALLLILGLIFVGCGSDDESKNQSEELQTLKWSSSGYNEFTSNCIENSSFRDYNVEESKIYHYCHCVGSYLGKKYEEDVFVANFQQILEDEEEEINSCESKYIVTQNP